MKSKKIIKNFLTAMRTQDNRGTAEPFFYVIRSSDWALTAPGEGERIRYWSNDFEIECESKEAFIKHVKEVDPELEEEEIQECVEDLIPNHLKRIYKEDGLFLTESDAEAHLKANHYNYSDDAHTYVKHAWRTTELHDFIKALFDYFKIEKG